MNSGTVRGYVGRGTPRPYRPSQFGVNWISRYVVANLIAHGWPVGTPGGRGHLVRLALVGALVMTAWDLVVDPILSGPTVGALVWERGGPYYGVPVQNYLGWIVTTFTAYLLYRSVERRWTPQPVGPLSLGPSGIPSSPTRR